MRFDSLAFESYGILGSKVMARHGINAEIKFQLFDGMVEIHGRNSPPPRPNSQSVETLITLRKKPKQKYLSIICAIK